MIGLECITVNLLDVSEGLGDAASTRLCGKRPALARVKRRPSLSFWADSVREGFPGEPAGPKAILIGLISCAEAVPFHREGLLNPECSTRHGGNHPHLTQ